MLPVNTLALLQSTLLAPATPLGGGDAGAAVRANSDPLDASRAASLDAANEAALMGMVRSSLPVAGAASVYQAMMALQGQVGWWGMGAWGGGMGLKEAKRAQQGPGSCYVLRMLAAAVLRAPACLHCWSVQSCAKHEPVQSSPAPAAPPPPRPSLA